jgi:hypothetical protein
MRLATHEEEGIPVENDIPTACPEVFPRLISEDSFGRDRTSHSLLQVGFLVL